MAWACGHCFNVSAATQVLGIASKTTRGELAELSKKSADDCCLCSGCGKVTGPALFGGCEPCRAERERQREERWEAERPAREAESQAYQAALAKAKDRDAAVRLYEYMSEISDDVYSAGWLLGLEGILWRQMQGVTEAKEAIEDWNGNDTGLRFSELRRLSAKAGGWWMRTPEHSARFVTLDEWQEMQDE